MQKSVALLSIGVSKHDIGQATAMIYWPSAFLRFQKGQDK